MEFSTLLRALKIFGFLPPYDISTASLSLYFRQYTVLTGKNYESFNILGGKSGLQASTRTNTGSSRVALHATKKDAPSPLLGK